MNRLGRSLMLFGVVVLFGFGIFFGVTLSRWAGGRTSGRTYSTPALLQQVQALSELVTIKYVISKVEILEVPSENLVGQMIGSENRVLLFAQGIVKAGIDLDRIKLEDLQVEGKTVRVKLPPARITDAYLDEKATQIIDRKSGLLAPSDKDLEQTTRRNALDGIRRSARTSGILTEADARARAELVNLFTLLGFEKVEFAPASATSAGASETSERPAP